MLQTRPPGAPQLLHPFLHAARFERCPVVTNEYLAVVDFGANIGQGLEGLDHLAVGRHFPLLAPLPACTRSHPFRSPRSQIVQGQSAQFGRAQAGIQ